MKFLIVFVTICSLLSQASSIEPTVGGRIVGGIETDISAVPYQVALLRDGIQLCGGSIIASNLILTAAHCVEERVIPTVSRLNIRAGSSLWRSDGQRVAVQRIIIHPEYSSASVDFDIAVLVLATNVNVANAVVVPLVDNGELFAAGTYGTVSGWGVERAGASTSPETLRKVDVPVVDLDRCRRAYGSIISERTICAGYLLGGRDACQGDSGGPYVINGRLAGVVSFGAGCATPLFPGVYASVGGLRTWINEVTGL